MDGLAQMAENIEGRKCKGGLEKRGVEREGWRKRGRRGEEGMEKERKIIYHLRINCNTDDVSS